MSISRRDGLGEDLVAHPGLVAKSREINAYSGVRVSHTVPVFLSPDPQTSSQVLTLNR